MAKCVEDVNSFDKFKENLEKWADGLKGANKAEAKETVDEILTKLQKKNLTYQDFYMLTSETSNKDNVVNKLSVLLFKNTNFEGFKYDGVEEDQEQQRKYLIDPRKMSEESGISENSVIKMLLPIFPFPLQKDLPPIKSVDRVSPNMELSKNTIYLFHDGQHFDLLHSKLDRNLAKAVGVEEKVIEAQRAEALKMAKDLTENEKPYVAPKKSADLNQQIVKKDLASKKPIVQTQQTVRQNPALEKPIILDQQEVAATNPKLPQQANLQDSQQKTLERLKTEFNAKNLAVPSSKTFAGVAMQKESDLAKRLEQQYGSKPDSKTKDLITKEVKNQDKVFVNKFVRALNRLRNIIQDSKPDFKEEKIWGNLTTLDKRVLIDYHNKNNEGSELVKFEPLAKDDLKKVLSYAVQEIPESSISGTEAKRLYKNIINETAR